MDADLDALDERLRAVERAVSGDGRNGGEELPAADALRERVDGVADRLATAEERLDDLDADTQALRGAVGALGGDETHETARTGADPPDASGAERARSATDGDRGPVDSRCADRRCACEHGPNGGRTPDRRVGGRRRARRAVHGDEWCREPSAVADSGGQERGSDRWGTGVDDPGRRHPVPDLEAERDTAETSLLDRLLGR